MQEMVLERILGHLRRPQSNVLLVAGTGLGKTAVARDVLKQNLGANEKAIAVAPRVALRDQLERDLGVESYTCQRLGMLLKSLPHADLVIWDEAHSGTGGERTQAVLSRYMSTSRVLGLTATDYQASDYDPSLLFDNVVRVMTDPPRPVVVQYAKSMDNVASLTGYGRVIIFCSNVRSVEVCRRQLGPSMRFAGLKLGVVIGATGKAVREHVLANADVIVTCLALVEGLNVPGANVAAFAPGALAGRGLGRLIQAVGRVRRVWDGVDGCGPDDPCYVVDIDGAAVEGLRLAGVL